MESKEAKHEPIETDQPIRHQVSDKLLDEIRQMVNKLAKVTKKFQSPLNEQFIMKVIDDVDAVLLDDNSLVETEAPIFVVGDIHGDYITLTKIFSTQGWPPEMQYLFLGDYIDRGQLNLEVITLLLLLKLLFPNRVYLLRGNHEAPNVNRYYGFKTELMHYRFTKVLWERFQMTFNCLPLAAVINKKIFCVHGGITNRLFSMDQIRKLRRPMSVPNDGFVLDLLWADPSYTSRGVEPNEVRNASVTFCQSTVKQWLQLHKLQLIIRAHEVVSEGYELHPGGRVLTVFSCPNYTYGNSAAIANIKRNLEITFTKFTIDSSKNHFDLKDNNDAVSE